MSDLLPERRAGAVPCLARNRSVRRSAPADDLLAALADRPEPAAGDAALRAVVADGAGGSMTTIPGPLPGVRIAPWPRCVKADVETHTKGRVT
jgi:hypothetical protein